VRKLSVLWQIAFIIFIFRSDEPSTLRARRSQIAIRYSLPCLSILWHGGFINDAAHMDYQETIAYLYSQLPMFQRIGPSAYKANLDNTRALLDHLGNPEKAFRSIHIAGTNGKGSVAHMLAAVLQAQGLKTGLATSPHLKDFRERIRVNGQPIPKQEVVRFVEQHKAFFMDLHPSFFEMTIAMTFDYFARERLDVAVVETGMGGRLDSTNVLQPEVSVITNIGLDHMRFLGHTMPDIAREKAGIIKENTPLVIGRRQPEVQEVFTETASRMGAPLTVASDQYRVKNYRQISLHGMPCLEADVLYAGKTQSYCLDLPGEYQLENLITVLATVDLLRSREEWTVSGKALQEGLQRVKRNTGMQGRWQQIGSNPVIICDTGHNREGITHIIRQLRKLTYQKLHMVFGMVADKDLAPVLSLLPKEARYYFCRPDVPRGLEAKKLAAEASFWGLEGNSYHRVGEALEQARKNASPRDLIFIGGSTFVVAEIL